MRQVVVLSLVLFMGCGVDITQVKTNSDIARIGPDKSTGNVEIIFNFKTVQGKTITVSNGNDRWVGVYITDYHDSGLVIFSDSIVRRGKPSIKSGVNFEHGQWLEIRIVVYKDGVGAISAFLESISDDFLGKLDDFWIEEEYTKVIMITEE